LLMELTRRHRGLPIQAFVDSVAGELLQRANSQDDLTLLGVEFVSVDAMGQPPG
jgi:hypothetical protein